jgi:ABC-type transport system substrate-binding protein
VLDRLRGATNDAETRAAVNDLQRRLYDDPPALFLAWPVVARAVSKDFEVPTEAGRDVMGSLWQWRPAAAPRP